MHLVCLFVSLILNLWDNVILSLTVRSFLQNFLRPNTQWDCFASLLLFFCGFSTLPITHTHTARRVGRKTFPFAPSFKTFPLLFSLFFIRKYWWNYFYLFIDFFLLFASNRHFFQLHFAFVYFTFLHKCLSGALSLSPCSMDSFSMKKCLDSFGHNRKGNYYRWGDAGGEGICYK